MPVEPTGYVSQRTAEEVLATCFPDLTNTVDTPTPEAKQILFWH